MGNSSQASKSPQSNKNNEVNNNKKLKHNLNKTPILSNESNPNVSKAYSIPSNEAEINNKMSENSVAEKNKKKSPPSHQSSFVKNSSSNKKDVIDKGETQSMKNNNLKETINIKKETDLIGINFNEINNKNESVSTKYDEAKNIKGNEPIIMPTFGTLGRSEKKHYLENLNLAVEKFGGKIVEEEDSIHLVTHCLVPCSLEHFEMNEIQLKEMNEFNQFDLLQMNPTSFKNENKLQIVVALSRTMKYMNAISLGELIYLY